jgi:chorismate synthase
MTRIETPRGTIEIREIASPEEMVEAERIEQQVWGADTKPHPKEILIAVQHEGGFVAGAFAPGGEMVGMIFGFLTRDPQRMHSHLLATLEDWRGLGIGAGMKWFQREWCLEHQFRTVQWTVDPLRAANAELNFRRLGVVSSRYYPDYYGRMNGIDAGAPSDRLLVEWDLTGERVVRRAASTPMDAGYPEAACANAVDRGESVFSRTDLEAEHILIRIPDDFVRLARTDQQAAVRWRLETRALFQAYLERGYRIAEFTRVGGAAYLLVKDGFR